LSKPIKSYSASYDALHQIAFQRVHRAGHRQIGLAGAGRADAEGDVEFLDLPQVLILARGARMQIGLARHQHRHHAFLRFAAHPGLEWVDVRRFHHGELDVLDAQAALRALVKTLQQIAGQPRLLGAALDAEMLAAARDLDAQAGLDLAQVFIQRAAQIGEALVIDGGEGDFHIFIWNPE
jgi:hypothetical protein